MSSSLALGLVLLVLVQAGVIVFLVRALASRTAVPTQPVPRAPAPRAPVPRAPAPRVQQPTHSPHHAVVQGPVSWLPRVDRFGELVDP